MQTVVMFELEGFADVQLTTKESGTWTIPPYFIDSVAHLAGFIMNCSDAMDTKNNYCVTPGWDSMRFAKPLVPGAKYRSYVKMIPTEEDPTIFFGDVYIMQDGEIIGLVGGIQFRRYPRILLSRFFSPPDMMDVSESKPKTAIAHAPVSATAPKSTRPEPTTEVAHQGRLRAESSMLPDSDNISFPVSLPNAAPYVESAAASGSTSARALMLIANEAGLEIADLEDDAEFSNLGVDSLMSLVIAEKFKTELDVKVGGSLFLDYPTIGDLRKWMEEYYS